MSGHTVHSPEKLDFRVSQYEANIFTIGTEDGDWLMSVRHSGEQVEARQIANMARLVGCWNALHDLPQNAIVGGWTRAGLEAHCIAMQADRDRLLEALQKIIDMNVQYCIAKYGDAAQAETMSCVTTAREAIAKSTGEKA